MHSEFVFDNKTYKELQKGRILFYSIMGVIGIIGVILFIFLYQAFDQNKYLMILFIPSLVFAGFGIGYVLLITFMLFKVKNVEVNFTYDFKKEFVRVKTYSKGELTSDSELHYNYIYRYKETKHYFFMYLQSKKVFPLSIEDENLEEIKKLIKIEDIPVKKI